MESQQPPSRSRLSHHPMQQQPQQQQTLLPPGFPHGLVQALEEYHAESFAQRIWILDNSGSMAIGDGYRIVETSDGKIQGQAVTRWEELRQTALCHAELAALLQLPTQFRLLNYPGDRIGVQEICIAMTMDDDNEQDHGDNDDNDKYYNKNGPPSSSSSSSSPHLVDEDIMAEELRKARSILQRIKPSGVTPLTNHVLEIEETLRRYQEELLISSKQVTVVIATDGLPTNANGDESDDIQKEFVQAIKLLLEDLPVWLVIRLCTNEPKVTEFYNQLDSQLELSLEVLDDHCNEAKQVGKYNPWLNYALPLHQCREMGFQHCILDLLDERTLTLDEVREFCIILFGDEKCQDNDNNNNNVKNNKKNNKNNNVETSSWPDPSMDWIGFVEYLQRHLNGQIISTTTTTSSGQRQEQQEQQQLLHWDTRKKIMAPWIHIKILTQKYRRQAGNYPKKGTTTKTVMGSSRPIKDQTTRQGDGGSQQQQRRRRHGILGLLRPRQTDNKDY